MDLDHSSGITVGSGSGGGDIHFHSTVDGGRALTVNAGTGSVTFSAAVGGTTKLESLTVTGGQVDLNTVATTGAISITGTNIDLNAATYNSEDGDITFTGPVDLHTDVSIDSDQDADETDGNITFASTLDGAHNLILNSDTGNIEFKGNVGLTPETELTTITITKAHDVTVGDVTTGTSATMRVGTFTQHAGTGDTDFGLETLYADTVVVNTYNIFGGIIAVDATLNADNQIDVITDVETLKIKAKEAEIDGKIKGIPGQGGADQILITDRGSGPYRFGGYTILGTGAGTRTYAELSALPIPSVLAPRGSQILVSGFHDSYIPILRASVNDSITGPYWIGDYNAWSPLLIPQPGTEEYYEDASGVIRTTR
ncbi:MAG: hypothetical protein F4Z15_00150 [Gammaproteobacteria bacterium]|nr:hypothetical protein [Gammaproteobacteria bacterium]MYD76238.1 hypothetical protein [Gammaproteobacteria bacterium]MYJ52821.1 hypothetical protein [Gammaproteobacteria bacterium]